MGDVIPIAPGVIANFVRQSVMRGEREVFLSAQQFEILTLTASARSGITPQRIFDCLFAHLPDGGPLVGHRTICAQRVHLNRKLAPLEIAIRTHGHGRAGGVYEIAISAKEALP